MNQDQLREEVADMLDAYLTDDAGSAEDFANRILFLPTIQKALGALEREEQK